MMAPDHYDNVKSFENHLEKAEYHDRRAEWELAENELRDAESLCGKRGYPKAEESLLRVQIRLADILRRHGEYSKAIAAHQEALKSRVMTEQTRIEVLGELGVNHRHNDDLAQAAKTFQDQLDRAQRVISETEAQVCRAVGNLGLTLFQQWEEQPDKTDRTLLIRARKLLEQRVSDAERLRAKTTQGDALWNTLSKWKVIGLSRLSLVYAADGSARKAIDCAHQGLEMSAQGSDPTIHAMSCFLYGYALYKNGDIEKAQEQFNFGGEGQCTPAIAYCKEPSKEHNSYLEFLINRGVNLLVYDEHGYSALDYAIYNANQKAIDLVENGLQKTHNLTAHQIIEEESISQVRTHFRRIFQAKFRPILNSGRRDCISSLQKTYQSTLDSELDKRERFDELRVISLTNFSKHGSLPLLDNTQTIAQPISQVLQKTSRPFLVFMSYRWIGPDREPNTRDARYPDDANNTQYHRMNTALAELIDLEDVNAEDVYIWLDCACIDQQDLIPGRRIRGIRSLPMYLAQCNAMISLLDSTYYDRAWCSVEVLLEQTLRRANPGVYRWYEHCLHEAEGKGVDGALREGRERNVEPQKLHLSLESDRKYIAFLQRQGMLLKPMG